MDRTNRIKLIVGSVLIIFGILAAGLPKRWIEETFGFEPDGGNGLVELALAAIPLAIGAALAVSVWRSERRVRRPSAQPSSPAPPNSQ
jgi:hypothetical protein